MPGPFKPPGFSHTKRLNPKIEELLRKRQACGPFRETGTDEETNHAGLAPLTFQQAACQPQVA
jgi:hypothetical protein